jgi:organic radical activating enzyme
MDWQQKLQETKNELDAVSPSFCLAKWLQVTLHLQNGLNHSCHHPTAHKTPLEELAGNPGALHNTAYKMGLREQMLAGKRPPECSYCWSAEDAGGGHFSDRVVKSSDDWARGRMGEIAALPANAPVNPSYVEISLGSLCNFRCSYCLPHVSSSIWQQYEKHGPYVDRFSTHTATLMGLAPIPEGEKNPYVEAFWKWLPDMSQDLRVLRITGGEPLLAPQLDPLFDYLEKVPHPHLELGLNSNLGVPPKKIDHFLSRLQRLSNSTQLKKFMLYTSADTSGPQAEYIRTGLDYKTWLSNIRKFLRTTPWNVGVMATFNALSPPSFRKLLTDLAEINREEGRGIDGQGKRVLLDVNHLVLPSYFSPWVLDDAWKARVYADFEWMKTQSIHEVGEHGFTPSELNKMGRTAFWLKAVPIEVEKLKRQRGNFYLFTNQYQEREGVAFLDVFPEMKDFLSLCREAAAGRKP